MPSTPKKILIVDDEEILLELLVEYFTSDNWTVEQASNGSEALSKIDVFKPDVILSDINMPLLDGIKLLETLYNKESLIPVILLTGYRDVDKMKKAWSACAYDFLEKPFKSEILLETAQNAFLFGKEYVETARKRYSKLVTLKNKVSA